MGTLEAAETLTTGMDPSGYRIHAAFAKTTQLSLLWTSA